MQPQVQELLSRAVKGPFLVLGTEIDDTDMQACGKTRKSGRKAFCRCDPRIRFVPRGIQRGAWFAALVFVNCSVAQSPCTGIHVKILNIRDSTEL
jgi:hypothetical protein